ncbi:uncharacterized protein LOC132378560 isoform X1 [Hypanus sabinus]|uniref:uncharacterized protein LOC132378560 isoform X1 n=1 Tax=Hypanus sabinus TaxID=79690 RepID=UPI0028C3F25E|nr:uncharacterized protein LOC132378560 isoform X1 [Hypanus sabinus]XP_059801546.1 uncharacterized protein LOC132378560 isoform X1 [Hypanus sabinus]XP_059801547.1 uncharacterized protein LOC132378560 isoform X1 [Hypanus sabinus]XP_059801548.1 uncharacterized protein LOC132378560 isoform X1 [Hypanus sabinus]XP_059801549.1 uncharacterized protein LOC132378560 isoform X1 [Hypanus sabinus]
MSVKEGETPVPVQIWRDTGAEQSLILSKVLDFGPETGEVVLRGIGKGTEAVPLHRIIINCDLVSGPVEIRVRSEFPRADVDVLLGNDLAGGEVWSAMKLTSQPVSVEDLPLDSKIYPACAITRSMSRKAVEKDTSLNESCVDLAETFLPTLYQEGLEGGKPENREVKESKGKEVDLPLARRKFIEARSKNEKQIRLLEGPRLDMDDLSGLTELFEEVKEFKCVPDNEIRAVLDEKDAVTLKESAGLADEVVLTHRVEFTPEGSCPESNWEDQGNLEFEKGTGIESLEEADVPSECVQDVDAHGTEPSNEIQEKSEVFDSVKKECNPCGSDRLGSVKKELTLVIVGSENSQLFVFKGVLKVSEEIKGGDVDIIIEREGKSVVPKLNKENLKSGLVSEAVTRLKEQWLVNKVPANQLQFNLECKGTTLTNVIQGCAVKRQNLKCCLDKEGSLADIKLKTNRMKGPENKTNDLLKNKELCGSSENGLSLENIVDKITPMKGACKSLFHTGKQANHVRVNWKRGKG